jgi:hypothetical protein
MSKVPFIDEVEEFNSLMNKPNNYEPTIPEKKEWEFVYNFVLEELEEYRVRIKFGQPIKKYKPLTYLRLAKLKMRHEKRLRKDPKSKVNPATMKWSVISILYTARVTGRL